MEAPTFREKLTNAATSLLGKYFLSNKETFKPSLIAFPHSQVFPSRVHKVMHSSRTGWLIDVMQLLQGLPFSRTGRISGIDSSLPHQVRFFHCILSTFFSLFNFLQYPTRSFISFTNLSSHYWVCSLLGAMLCKPGVLIIKLK